MYSCLTTKTLLRVYLSFNIISSVASQTLGIPVINSSVSEGSFSTIVSKTKAVVKASKNSKQVTSDDESDEDDTSKLFSCPVEGCVKMYQRFTSLDNHLQYGKCKLEQEKESLFDKAIALYQEKLQTQAPPPSLESSQAARTEDSHTSLDRGWALKTTKKAARFSENQKAFLDEMFSVGQETAGNKQDPNKVAQDMRHARNMEGSRRFQLQEFLTPKQIQSYFSRKAAKLKKGKPSKQPSSHDDEKDADAAEEETAYQLLRNDIIDKCQLTHPISYRSINLCDLYVNQKMKKLSLPVLKSICEELDLDASTLKPGRKDPYIKLICTVLKSCSCAKEVFV